MTRFAEQGLTRRLASTYILSTPTKHPCHCLKQTLIGWKMMNFIRLLPCLYLMNLILCYSTMEGHLAGTARSRSCEEESRAISVQYPAEAIGHLGFGADNMIATQKAELSSSRIKIRNKGAVSKHLSSILTKSM